ncbi:MAG TPA: hypothetical protein DEQ02_02970, partial [Ruminococcaceae bacterium]|nr:hypothetical protein [Oscillospiraceae bacterium]
VEAGKGEDNAWENASFRSYSGGGALRSNKQGDTITLTFYGRGIEIIGYKSWSRGKLDVTLDGVTETVSCFDMSYDKTYNTAIYDSGDLGSSGWHTLTLTVRGDKDFLASSTAIDIDAFVVKRFPPTIVN